VLVTLGYSSWGEGQLESELAENAWLTVGADLSVIFDTPVPQRYDKALGCWAAGLDALAGGGARMTGLPVQPAVPAHFQTFLAFDFGLKRTGVATGNRMLRSATPQPPSRPRAMPALPRWPAHQGMAARRAGGRRALPPRRREPREHRRALKFGRQLRGRFGLQVFEVDERYSTTEAIAGQGAKDADAASACIILEQFLRNLP
jgi:putative Holliday junction resolvase